MENGSDHKLNLPSNKTGTLTQRKRGRNPINVTINRIQNKKFPIRQHLNRIRFNSKLASIKHSLHTVPTLELHHRLPTNRCNNTPIKHKPTDSKSKKENAIYTVQIHTRFGGCFE